MATSVPSFSSLVVVWPVGVSRAAGHAEVLRPPPGAVPQLVDHPVLRLPLRPNVLLHHVLRRDGERFFLCRWDVYRLSRSMRLYGWTAFAER